MLPAKKCCTEKLASCLSFPPSSALNRTPETPSGWTAPGVPGLQVTHGVPRVCAGREWVGVGAEQVTAEEDVNIRVLLQNTDCGIPPAEESTNTDSNSEWGQAVEGRPTLFRGPWRPLIPPSQ